MDFEELYCAYAEDVYSYVISLCKNQHIAEDVTSETFLKAIKAIDKFKGNCELRVWLCQVAKNTYFTLASKNRFITETSEDLPITDNFEHKLIEKSQAFRPK